MALTGSFGGTDSALTVRHLDSAQSSLSSSSRRLSSGLRINSASDDAAGLAISQSLRAQRRVYAQAIRNASDGIGLANVAQGAMVELTGILTRHAELAEQAANGMYSAAQRQALQTEATELTNEYNRIVDSTVFNGIKVFDSCEPTAHR